MKNVYNVLQRFSWDYECRRENVLAEEKNTKESGERIRITKARKFEIFVRARAFFHCLTTMTIEKKNNANKIKVDGGRLHKTHVNTTIRIHNT